MSACISLGASASASLSFSLCLFPSVCLWVYVHMSCHVCLCLFLSMAVSVCLCLSFSLYLSICACVSVPLVLCPRPYLCRLTVSVSLCILLWCLHPFLFISPCISRCLCTLYLSVSLSMSLSLLSVAKPKIRIIAHEM